MAASSSRSISLALPDGESVKVKWFGRTSKADLQETICESAGLEPGTRFQLVDDEGDVCVVSAQLPAGSTFTLRVVEAKRSANATKKRGRDNDAGETPDAKASKQGRFNLHDDAAAQVVKMGFSKSKVDPAIEELGVKKREINVANIISTIMETDKASQKAKDDESAEDDTCCICLDSYDGKALFVTECGHKFHFHCIRSYCEKGSITTTSCPLCRKSLPTPPGVVGRLNPQAHNRALYVSVPEDGEGSASHRRRRRRRDGARGGSSRDAEYSSSGEETHLVVGRAEHQETPPLIENWTYDFEVKVIKGSVHNYPGHEDGAPISTSPVCTVDGYSFQTASGSRYALGTPDAEFVADLGEHFDEENPLEALLELDRMPEPAPAVVAPVVVVEPPPANAAGRRSRRNRSRSATTTMPL